MAAPTVVEQLMALVILFATAVVVFRIISALAPRPLKFFEMIILSGFVVVPFILYPAQFLKIGFNIITIYVWYYVGRYIIQKLKKRRA